MLYAQFGCDFGVRKKEPAGLFSRSYVICWLDVLGAADSSYVQILYKKNIVGVVIAVHIRISLIVGLFKSFFQLSSLKTWFILPGFPNHLNDIGIVDKHSHCVRINQ